ncbi:MAG: M28 family peptidase [Bacteroidota bacterium]
MRLFVLALLFLTVACNTSQKTVTPITVVNSETKDPIPFAQTITEAELKAHLFVYASDAFLGRETGAPGQKEAVRYLKAYYDSLGIPAAQQNGNYFQKVPLSMNKVPSGQITVNGSNFELGKDFLTFSQAVGSFQEVVYVGYGIEEGDYSDYKNIEVKDKIVLMKFGEPQNEDGNYQISGTKKKSAWSNVSEAIDKRVKLANTKGAKGILYYDPANFSRYQQYFNFMKASDHGKMQLKNESREDVLVLLNENIIDILYPELRQKDTPQNISAAIEFAIKSPDDGLSSENVIAFLEGSQKPEEYVVISSHLDHIGVTTKGAINNGADDDGSGTVAMLEIAEAFKEATNNGYRPKRSIVFLHVTGEEKGLLGSKYYTDYDPVFPLEHTIANLNIDMIGRIDPKRDGMRNYIYLIGSDKLSTELHQLSEAVNAQYCQIELDYTYNDKNDPNRFYYRSDHYNFAKNNIPVIFYFNGTHADYHQPSDTPDKINYDLLQNRAQLIFYTAWELANRSERIKVDKVTP